MPVNDYGEFKTYSGLHQWLRREHPKTGVCAECRRDVGTEKAHGTQWAFKWHPEPHTKNIDDYRELCRECHGRELMC